MRIGTALALGIFVFTPNAVRLNAQAARAGPVAQAGRAGPGGREGEDKVAEAELAA